MKTALSRVSGLLALLLIAAMMLTMVGCGTDTNDEYSYYSYYESVVTKGTTTTTEADNGDAVTTTTSATAAQADNVPDQTDLKKVPAELKGTKINMMIWWTEGGDDTKKAAQFLKDTGIEVKYTSQAMASTSRTCLLWLWLRTPLTSPLSSTSGIPSPSPVS